MADSPQKAADASVPVVAYEVEAKQEHNQIDSAPVQPQHSHEVSKKAALSAYMTIAAAAFGLISDGCMCKVSYCRLTLGPDI